MRGLPPAAYRLLASWKLSVVLMVAAALYHLLLAIWSTTSPSHVVQGIAGLTPYWLVYTLLLLNTGFCLWRRLPAMLRDISGAPLHQRARPRWELIEGVPEETGAARRLVRALGFSARALDDGGLWARRRRWSALGTFAFHLAFYLLALGWLLTLGGRSETKIWVAAGERFEGRDDQYMGRPGGLGDLRFEVEEIHPEFWRDMMLFTELRAELRMANGRRVTSRINDPLWLSLGRTLRLSSVGYTPRYELRDARGRVIESQFVKLRLFPPGQRDHFSPRAIPHRIYLSVTPDHRLDPDGQLSSRSLNLVNPAVEVEVWRGKQLLGGGLLTAEKGFLFEDLLIGFPEIRYWGEFTAVWDPGAPLVFLGFFIGMLGLLIKLPGKRAELRWLPARAGEPARLEGYGAVPRPDGLGGPVKRSLGEDGAAA